MNYSVGSGIIRYIRASKTFSKFRAFRSSVRFEVQCVSKFRVLRSSVRFEVPCAWKFRAVIKLNTGATLLLQKPLKSNQHLIKVYFEVEYHFYGV